MSKAFTVVVRYPTSAAAAARSLVIAPIAVVAGKVEWRQDQTSVLPQSRVLRRYLVHTTMLLDDATICTPCAVLQVHSVSVNCSLPLSQFSQTLLNKLTFLKLLRQSEWFD